MSTGHDSTAAETIGQRLKRLRLEHGLSQRELASPGVSYAYISRIEAGTRQPSVKALRRLAAKLGVSAEYLETGSVLDPAERRELRLTDLELAIRLGDAEGVDKPLHELIGEAEAAGDGSTAVRARVALASHSLERGEFQRTVDLLETALEGEPFSPVERYDIYANLGRAYAASGRPDRAVELFERCLESVADTGDTTLETRYATLLSYALSDMGDLVRAEQVVRDALDRVQDTEDPYMRVRLYWSMARLAHAEGEASVALTNARKAIALLQATDDSFHLARAHILAASISLSREDADAAERHLDHAEQLLGAHPSMQDSVEMKIQRSRIAALRGDAGSAVSLARAALDIVGDTSPADEGLAFKALGDGLVLSGEYPAADEAYRRAVELLEAQGQWREATQACRSWASMLRRTGHEEQALDVLDRATELGLRATPADARADH
ncbi:MAG TPA: helix-turn-helix domain-containing protein [Gaiellaceae bacterium]|nr:helix-turn-helix domain-containing protein [Gaiellaceae bacterium]